MIRPPILMQQQQNLERLQQERSHKIHNHYGIMKSHEEQIRAFSLQSYTLRYIGLRANGEHHRGFVEGLLNVNTFIQRHARHEHLTISEWKSFWRELVTDLYLDTVRMEQAEVDNNLHHHDHDHDHDHNHRHDRERNGRDDLLDLGRGRKRRRVISSELCLKVGSTRTDLVTEFLKIV
ncbi:MAG: hypothetical protein EZS28_024773, partial [Streblomastix strix]